MYDQYGYLGSAIKSPISILRGRASTVAGTETVRQSIERLLSTQKGTVFFSREYGSRLQEMLFEQNTDVATEMLRFYIFEAIRDWEPRVRFMDCQTTVDGDNINCLVRYRILATNEIQAFVYPFYRSLS